MLVYDDRHNKPFAMPSPPSSSRQQVVRTTGELLAQHGPAAASLRVVAKRAGAPFGSTYHYFPRGKQQVIAEAVESAGARIATELKRHLQSGPVAGLQGFLATWRDLLLRSNFTTGCPVLAVVVAGDNDEGAEEAQQAAVSAFDEWERLLAASLHANGCNAGLALQTATLIVASVEGAIVLCRARQCIDPLDRVALQLAALVAGQVAAPPARPGSA